MNIINTSVRRSNHIAGTQPCRTFFSFFKKKALWHGTSEGAIGEKQLNIREFLPFGNSTCVYLWPTEDEELAKRFALQSSRQTGTPAILVEVESEQKLSYLILDSRHHSYPAFDVTKAPIKMKKIVVLDPQGNVLKNVE